MPNNILITPGSASIQFSGSTDNIIRLQVQPLGQVDFISQSVSILNIGDTGIVTTGSITATSGITGSLLGTASFAQTASFFTGSVSFPSGLIVTGSILATTVSASSFIGTSSFATSASFSISSSRSITASFAFSSSAATSITFTPTTSSYAATSSVAISSSFAISASWAPAGVGGGVTSLTAGDGLTGGTITSTGTITVDTGSTHFLDGVKKELNTESVISSSAQVSYTQLQNIPSGIVSSSTQVITLLPVGTVSSSTQVNYTQLQNIPSNIVSSSTQVTAFLPTGTVSSSAQISTGSFTGSFKGTLITPILSASIFTGSHVQLNALTDTTATNKVLVLDTTTNKIFTTASVGGGGSSSPAFPFNGSAVITGSLLISRSAQAAPLLQVSGGIQFLTGSTRVYTSADGNTFGGLYVETTQGGLADVVLEAGGGVAYIGSNTSNIVLFSGGATRALINTNGILPGSDLGNDLGEGASRWRNIYAGAITSSLFGTSSWASNAISSSFATTASFARSASFAPAPAGVISSSLQFKSLTAPFTGSFTGSFSGSLDRFNPASLRITVGTTAPSSPAVNDLWVDTN